MFESQIGDFDDERVGGQAIGLDNDRLAISFCGIQQRPELFECNFLVAHRGCDISTRRGWYSEIDWR